MTTLTTMTDCSVEPMTADLDGWKVIAGNPGMKTWIEYTSPDESMITGCWEATPGTYHATYASWEFIHIIEGEAVITPDGGEPKTIKAGDALMLEADFVGTWEIKQKIFKHFAIKLK
ncbi:cupin domain-containing protein [Neptuniibacter halophilus]|uniref:cupin domain-containing protein n=1 Tax=Neptuniibacter halophilus TaxID=651666 RepID=UPI002572B912|nr:cupin domain-containing protein [Neptuniibacter halophilus]